MARVGGSYLIQRVRAHSVAAEVQVRDDPVVGAAVAGLLVSDVAGHWALRIISRDGNDSRVGSQRACRSAVG
jgi:hypothetical protein